MPRQPLPVAQPSGVTIDRRVSVAAQVFDLIRQEIVRSSLTPGTPLSEAALSQRFGVSRTPIREALLRLSEEGLVQIVPQVGTYVTRISLAKVYEAQFIREALECAAARAAAQNPQRIDTALLEGIMTRQRRAASAGDHSAFYAADEELHASIAAASGFPRVWSVASAEKLHLDRVRMLDVSQRPNLGELVKQHAAVVDALKSGDQRGAEDAMRAHLRDVFDRLRPLIAVHRAYFDDVDLATVPFGSH
jgi:GntR family transcriptional regulator, rspAB operon transcriptional repressor